MKETEQKLSTFNRIEFWAATTLYVFIVFFFITDSLESGAVENHAPNKFLFDRAGIPFHYHSDYFIPRLVRYTFIYLAFLLVNFVVVPGIVKKQSMWRNISLVVLLFVSSGLLYGITDTYLRNYLFNEYEDINDAYSMFFWNSFLYASWLLFVLAFYSVIKYGGLYLLRNAEVIQARYKIFTRDTIAASVVWMILMFILMVGAADEEILALCAILIPCAILLYGYCFAIRIPKMLNKKRPFVTYMLGVLLVLAIAYLPVSLVTMVFVDHEEVAFAFGFFNTAFQLLITAPLAWVLFKRQMKGKEEIFVLQKELGQTHANFDFLRSQINPHFLFNALNTIYGTAIQEKAERTSEAVEKLGDMMRFMLHENVQEKISLAREIEYLDNYISLQKLRTDSNPIIQIQTHIQEPVDYVQIAPMLLIPFVENAFKHGISLRNPSHVNVTLEMKEKTLFFDVYNSKHAKQENDPEKFKSGIGLNNVRQRLKLLYPHKHELIVRETGKEFFIHLTINLS